MGLKRNSAPLNYPRRETSGYCKFVAVNIRRISLPSASGAFARVMFLHYLPYTSSLLFATWSDSLHNHEPAFSVVERCVPIK